MDGKEVTEQQINDYGYEPHSDVDDLITKLLTKLGNDGWELISVDDWRMFFKRPKY
jgi:hypothetical protein